MMSKSLFLLLGLMLITLNISSVSATQFIPYTGTVQVHTPKICVVNNSGGYDGVPMTQDAVNTWANKLNHLTHSTKWNMTVELIEKMQMSDCNIVFNYTLQPSDPIQYNNGIDPKPVAGRILAETTCNNVLYGHTYCQIDVYLLNNNPKIIFATIQHEFGHALGLGHRQGNTVNDSMRAFLSDDIMFGSAKTFQYLTNEDALAVIHMYGVNGFTVVSVPNSPYIIPYLVHLKVYCNGVSGKICYELK